MEKLQASKAADAKFLAQAPSYCRLAWSHAFIGPGGQVKPCCRFRSNTVPANQNLNQGRDLKENLQSAFMEDLRTEMTAGKSISGCQRCYEEEQSGKGKSLRQIYNRDEFIHHDLPFFQQELRYLELSSSNLCNLACRMCEPRYSVRWARDWERLYDKKTDYGSVRTVDVEKILPYLKHIRHVKFTGGEPLLIPEYTKILEEIVDQGNASKVFLNYSTNLTVFPSDELLSLWEKFSHVEIAFSLDGIGPVNEYIRYPSKWSVVEKNIENLLRLSRTMNVRCGLRSTIMIYNIFDVPNIFNWWRDKVDLHYREPFDDASWFNPTHVTFPQHLSLRVLPQELKRLVEAEYKRVDISPRVNGFLRHLCGYMNAEDDSYLLPEFLRFTNELDRFRNQDFRNLHPKFASLLG